MSRPDVVYGDYRFPAATSIARLDIRPAIYTLPFVKARIWAANILLGLAGLISGVSITIEQ